MSAAYLRRLISGGSPIIIEPPPTRSIAGTAARMPPSDWPQQSGPR